MNRFSLRHGRLLVAMLAGMSIAASGFAAPTDQKKAATKAEEKARKAAAIRSAVAHHELLPLPKLLAIAQAAVPGEVIKVEVEFEENRVIYDIKILAGNGRVREVELDGRTGAVIKVEDD